MTCVKNAQGQVFCYETLPTDEHCLKRMVEEDPPLWVVATGWKSSPLQLRFVVRFTNPWD